MCISQYITGVQPRRFYFRGIYVAAHLNMLLRLFVQLPISFPALLCLVLNSSFILFYGLKWHFNPPLSPWWKGIFERMAR